MHFDRNDYRLPLAILAITIILFTPFLHHGFITLDDDLLITHNPVVQSLNTTTVSYVFTSYDPELYVPLTLLSFQIEHAIAGSWAPLYHATSLLLHAASAVLVFWIFKSLTKKQWMSLAVAILFAIHPIQTEAVLWASARKDVLSGFFFLAALYQYLQASSRGSGRAYAFSVTLFIFALLSKITVVCLPVILILIEWRKNNLSKASLKRLLPYVLASLIFGIIALAGKSSNLGSLSLWEQGVLFVQSIGIATTKLLLPTNLSLLYAQQTSPSILNIHVIGTIVVLVVLATLLRKFRNPIPDATFGIAWYLLMLIPQFGTFVRNGYVFAFSDRYVYLACIGLFFALVHLAYRIPWKSTKAPTVLAVGIFTSLFVLTVLQATTWSSSKAAYNNVLKNYPCTAFAENGMGELLMEERSTDAARAAFSRAIACDSDMAEAHLHLAELDRQTGNYKQALLEYENAMEAVSHKRGIHASDLRPFYGRGEVLKNLGRYQESLKAFEDAVTLAPSVSDAHYNLGLQYQERGMTAEAEMQFRSAITLAFMNLNARYHLAGILSETGKLDEAMRELESIVAVNPQFAKAKEHLSDLRALQVLRDSKM